MSKKAVLLLLFVAGFLVSCSPSPKPDSIVLVIIDTCRADHVGAVRGENEVTPFLDDFAGQATVFTRAYSHSPWTLPSLASLFTSQVPMHHGAGGRLGELRSLPEEAVTLAEACRDAGLGTAAISNVQFLSTKYGTTQGFDHVDFVEHESNLDSRRAAETTDAALAWLASNGEQPFLLVVHYFDPHLVYDPPEPFRARFAAGGTGGKMNRNFGQLSQIQQIRKGNLKLTPEDFVRLGGLYDGEISYTDAEFGRFLQGLEELGAASRAVVTVLSDHGEEFNDHGSFEHGHTQYDELLHVPLLIRAPGAASRAARITAPVALKDVGPTLCELIDVPTPPAFSGRSLVPAFTGGTLPSLPILSQGNMWGPEQAALRMGNWKVIVETVSGEREEKSYKLFDLSEDPGEQRNLAEEHPARLAEMTAYLDGLLSSGKTEGDAPELSEKERERLRSLGYVR